MEKSIPDAGEEVAWGGLGGTCSEDGRVKEVGGREQPVGKAVLREHVAWGMQWGAGRGCSC